MALGFFAERFLGFALIFSVPEKQPLTCLPRLLPPIVFPALPLPGLTSYCSKTNSIYSLVKIPVLSLPYLPGGAPCTYMDSHNSVSVGTLRKILQLFFQCEDVVGVKVPF